MSYTSPFTITTDILNLVADTSEQVGKLNAITRISPPHLHKQNCIKTIARAIVKLQQVGEPQRVGSDKTGHWEVQK